MKCAQPNQMKRSVKTLNTTPSSNANDRKYEYKGQIGDRYGNNEGNVVDYDKDGDGNDTDEDDIFYIPKKKRVRHVQIKPEVTKCRQQASNNDSSKPVTEKKNLISSKSQQQVKIIECNNIDTNDSNKGDIPYEYVSHARLLAGKKDNALVTTFFAINIFLQPRNVYSTTLYWISQYVNYKKSNPVHWFTDHVYKLMKYPVDFNMVGTRGVSDFHSKEVKYNLLIHTIGSSLHKIPCEYFIIQSNESMLRAILYLINPSNECFITNRHHGLKGELEVDSFVYNSVMNFIYEPSFFIITSYLHYTYQLFFSTGRRNILDYTDILDTIIVPLRLECKLGCLTESSTNYESKKSVFIQDIKELLSIYETHALCAEGIVDGLKKLWCKKASYCFSIMSERFLAIHKQLY